MTALVLAALAAVGTHLVVSERRPTTAGVGDALRRLRRRADEWLAQAGLAEVERTTLVAATAALALLGASAGALLFGTAAPAAVTASFAAAFPAATYRRRRAARKAVALDAWPRIVEEIRVLTGSAGRSIPQALFDAGLRAPAELRPAFAAAHRTWLLTTDLARTLAVLKSRLADPTCDAACETLLVAHELGGTDLDRRLEALAADRRLDAQCRKDARARQSGVRFARRFVLLVPLGMAAAGLSVGDGRSAYRTGPGQAAVLVGLLVMIACWVWAGRILRLPDERRVFAG